MDKKAEKPSCTSEDSDHASDKQELPSPQQQPSLAGTSAESQDAASQEDSALAATCDKEIDACDEQSMDRDRTKKRLHSGEDSNSSSDKECLPSSTKRSKSQFVGEPPKDLDATVKDASAPSVSGKEIQVHDVGKGIETHKFKRCLPTDKNLNTADEGYFPGTTKRSSIDEKIPEVESMELADASATTERSGIVVSESARTRYVQKILEEEREEYNKFINTTHLREMTESEKQFSARTEAVYMNLYARVYSKELLFGVDVVNLVRHLNHLPLRYMMYNTSGEKPKSPCDDTMDDALAKIWNGFNTQLKTIFTQSVEEKGINYRMFQQMVIDAASRIENRDYKEEAFLMYCVAISGWGVFAELSGVANAPSFVPLVICRTVKTFECLKKIKPDFWERLAKFASEKAIA